MNTSKTLSKSRLGKMASLILACLFFITVIIINVLPFFDGRNDLMDFGSFYASGIKSRNGENPYDPNSEFIFEINFSRVGAGGKMVNLNPPISIGIFEYLSRFDPNRSLILWQITSAILYAGSILLLALAYKKDVTPMRFIWAFTLAGLWHTIVLGQVYIVLLFFTVLGWIFLQKGRYVLAGLAIALVIVIKPNFIIWTIFLLASGYYLTVLVSLALGLVVSLLPVFFYGTEIYRQWLEASALRIETLAMPGNNSILGLTARFDSISLGLIVSLIVVLVLLVLSRLKLARSMEQLEYVSGLGIIASIMASPISWTGYTILLLPLFFSLKRWTIPIVIAAAILSIPFQIVLLYFQTSFVNFVVFGWLYGWGILLLLGDLVAKIRAPGQIQVS